MSERSERLELTIQEYETLPSSGDTYEFVGLAGKYAVTIHRVLKIEKMPDKSRRVSVRATRHLISEAKEKPHDSSNL